MALAPCLTQTALQIATSTSTAYDRQYSLYAPELNLLAETSTSTNTAPPIAYEYIWFAGEPLAQVNVAANQIHYYFNDHLGTPILQTDATARIVWQVEYEPYGTVYAMRRGEAKHQPMRFPGQEAWGSGELSYNVHRWYRGGWGRYTQADPLDELRASEPNLYRYARANPATFSDPLGLWSVDKSCDECPGGYCFGGKKAVTAGVSIACNKFLKKPKCAALIENLQFSNTMDTGKAEPLGPCMRRLCDSDNKIFCAQNTNPQFPGACAKANPGGALTLMCGSGTGSCYFDKGAGWSHTIFHEMVHVCGLTDTASESYGTGPYSKLFQKIMWTCAGVLD
jgi:RHS repeat-associated protein